jgi:eukaryotic-like serine/threonine-protein kinase
MFFDHYRLVLVVRRRGLAKTYRAVDEQDGKIVAVKLVPGSPGSRDHLQREFDIGSRLSHPSLLRYYACVHTDDYTGLVTEFVEGETFLAALARLEPHTLRNHAASAFLQLGEAIGYLHKNKLVHANLSPSGIVWTTPGALRLIDLGHCQEFPPVTDHWAGEFHGTLKYSSPEHGWTSLVPESDYFVVGLLLIEHLTRTNLFCGDSMSDLFARIRMADGLPDFISRQPWSEERKNIVGSLLSAVPEKRRLGWRKLMVFLRVTEALSHPTPRMPWIKPATESPPPLQQEGLLTRINCRTPE